MDKKIENLAKLTNKLKIIIFSKKYSKKKYKLIKKLTNFNNKEITKLFNILNKFNKIIKNQSAGYLKKYLINLNKSWFSLLKKYKNKFNDYKKPLDFVYLYLFIFASIPILGLFSDYIIIIKAINENRLFLAINTIFTRLITLFSLNILDLGTIIKLLYTFDTYSYI